MSESKQPTRHRPRAASHASFGALLGEIKARIQSGQTRALVAVNRELVRLYWDIGRIIHLRQKGEGWGAAIVPRLSRALHNELPELKGFSERNIERMLAFHREYPSVQAAVGEETPPPIARSRKVPKVPLPVALLPESLVWSIPWAHHIILMEKVKDLPARRWYMEQALAHGWSRDMLALQIQASAHARHGRGTSNFSALLPPPQSELTQQALKDPYIFDFYWPDPLPIPRFAACRVQP